MKFSDWAKEQGFLANMYRKMSVDGEIEKFMKINQDVGLLKTKEEFVETVKRIAERVWENNDPTEPRNIYKKTSINKLPETKEEVDKKVEEIKGRNAGAWEPYMVLKEIGGIDLIDMPDVDSKTIKKSDRPDPIDNRGVFRRADGKKA